ncbi:response regulator transcription factor [Propionivibrio sp.]|uniref:response regulator transcription factor n=1 Tax=Propionivibrio sp. TaxID=2212460 RepID=UPI0039E25B29
MNAMAATHRLLIVDDSMLVRNRIARLCSRAELSGIAIVGLAANGAQALAVAREQSPTLVTLDLTMPELDGEECIGQLAAMLPDARILVVSALSDKATALRAVRRGAHGFIHKPFRDEEIADALIELME